MNRRHPFLPGLLLMVMLACSFPAASTPPSGLSSTLAAVTPLTDSPVSFATPTFGSYDQPTGKIALTCQVFKVQASNQICIMNADGSGYRRLTTDGNRQHYYPSLAPDGGSVVYAAFREQNVYEIYEMNLADGSVKQLTDRLGIVNSPEISPDGGRVVFMHWIAAADKYELWIMNRDGGNPRRLFDGVGWDPSWSPDGNQVLFASSMNGSNQLFVVNADGTGVRQVSDLPALRGRSDWSPQNRILTYSGGPWGRELFALNLDGSDQRQISPVGGNSQGPSFSPDGQWVAFTAYFDKFNDIHGCEIYSMRVDGTELRRLTNNDYCDYQPRWGP
jgi:TolB protein